MNLEGWSTRRCGYDLIKKFSTIKTLLTLLSTVRSQPKSIIRSINWILLSLVAYMRGVYPVNYIKKRIRNEQGNCCCWDRHASEIDCVDSRFESNTHTLETYKYKARLS